MELVLIRSGPMATATRSSPSPSSPSRARPPAPERPTKGPAMDVAIVGTGLHPFGRFGERTESTWARWRSGSALAGRERRVEGHPVRLRRQLRGRQSRRRGGAPWIDGHPVRQRYNGSATAASVLKLAADAIRLGEATSASPSAWTSTFPVRSAPIRGSTRARRGTARSDSSSRRSSSAHEDQQYMQDHGISSRTLARVVAKSRTRNGALNPNAFRRKPMSEDEILGAHAQLPADPVHVLQP